MTLDQFLTLVKLMRGTLDTPSNIAARRVLVENVDTVDAIKDSGVQRASIYLTVKRYKTSHEAVLEAFSDANNVGAQFDLIVKLSRGNPDAPTTKAARSVIVDQMPHSHLETDKFSPSALSQAIKRYEDALEKVRKAYPPTSSGQKRKSNREAKPAGK